MYSEFESSSDQMNFSCYTQHLGKIRKEKAQYPIVHSLCLECTEDDGGGDGGVVVDVYYMYRAAMTLVVSGICARTFCQFFISQSYWHIGCYVYFAK